MGSPEEAPGHSRTGASSGRKPLLILAAAVFFLHFIVTGGHLMSPDEELMYRTAESMAFRGTTKILPLEADFATGILPPGFPPQNAFATRIGEEPGAFYAQYLPLQPLLAVPFVHAGKLLEGAFAEAFASHIGPGMTISYLETLPNPERARAIFRRGFLVMLFGPIISALSAVLLARFGRLLTGSRSAGLWAGALYSFATMAWPHARTFFTEPLAALLAFAALDQLARWQLMPEKFAFRHAVLAGVFLALANLTRVDAPLFTLGMILGMAVAAACRFVSNDAWARRGGRNYFLDVFVAGGIATSCWIVLQLFNHARYGFDLSSGYGDQSEGVKFSTPLLIGLHGFLASPGKGMFFFSPALLLGIWGWLRMPVRLRWLGWMTFGGYFPFFIAMAMWQNWAGGWCWGPRHIMQVHLPLMLGSVFLFGNVISPARRFIIYAVLLVGALVQLYGSSQSPLEYYREYFTTVRDFNYHKVNLEALQQRVIARDFVFAFRDRDGRQSPDVSPTNFPAPILDSIYVPQHTQWASYHQMWRLGFSDFYFFNAMTNRKVPDRWSEP
ncbi:hypothetical protein IT570_04335 [Candidatus Sumerlaeota bacterium]|nr:hypothetical protein [Candidatus Sumerlaeota bacterium]